MPESQTIEAKPDPLELFMNDSTIFIKLRNDDLTGDRRRLHMHNISRALAEQGQQISVDIDAVTGEVSVFVEELLAAIEETQKKVIYLNVPASEPSPVPMHAAT